VINDKSLGSVAAHLGCGGLFSYHFTKYLSLSFFNKKNFKISENLAKLQAKWLIVSCALFPLQFSA